tara:strand:- start:34004 stop:34162 length:159 start_codon:yes stop_codon:yes gene_type:complete
MHQPEYWYAVASVLLFLKMFAISAYQAFHRIGKLTFKLALPDEMPWQWGFLR